LNELAESKDAHLLLTEAEPLRTALLEQTQQTRSRLAYVPSEFRVDPAFLMALGTTEVNLPLEIQELSAMAKTGDWEAVQIRVDGELKPMETMTSSLVTSMDRELDEALPRAVANMKDVQRRIFIIVPATAISTVLIAAFFGWAIARRLLELRLEERVNERTRIARDLHDTLLQSFHAVLMKFSAVTYMLRDRPDAQKTLDAVIEQARQAVTEGRDAVEGLRSSTVLTNDLARALVKLGEELAAGDARQNRPEFRVHVEGASMALAPIVRDDVHRIASEAVRNAFGHAQAGRIEVEIHYERRQLRVRILDNGKGIDQTLFERGGRPGHFGLAGMQERARLVGGKLAVWSKLDSGTEIELTIPASIAYATGRSMSLGKGAS
jgi:signal transduction histidine kinase